MYSTTFILCFPFPGDKYNANFPQSFLLDRTGWSYIGFMPV